MKLSVALARSPNSTNPTLKQLSELPPRIRSTAARIMTVRRCNGCLSDPV
ncbi:MAG TPA: hypothetical protein V6D04_09765 [Candidatus Obscuribacterales bacterium]